MMSNRIAVRTAVVAAVAVVSLAACSGSGSDQGAESLASDPAADSAAESTSAGSSRDSASADQSRAVEALAAELPVDALAERAIERRGSLELSSDRVGDTRTKVVAAASRAGGYVASEHSTTGGDGRASRTSLQVVVPTERFDTAMTAIADAGSVVSREQSAEDVTDEVVDVDSRVKSAQSSLNRVRLLLGRAESLGDVIRLESVLGERQADLEALKARQQSLASRTSTATIDVSVRATPAVPEPRKDDDDDGFVAGLSAGWDGLTSVGTGLLTGLGAVLPFLVALGIPAVAVVLLVRRLLRRRTAAAA